MAVVDLTEHLPSDEPSTRVAHAPDSARSLEVQDELARASLATDLAGRVRLNVHDASRLEWSISVPLPDKAPLEYALRVEIEIPQNAFVRHSPWDQMQAFTRLDGPAAAAGPANSIDQIRRAALGMAAQISRAADGFARHCRLASSLFAGATHGDAQELEDVLTIWVDAAERIARETRMQLGRTDPGEPAQLTRERALVDEYVSVRLLEMLAGAERVASRVVAKGAPHAEELAPIVAAVEGRLGKALEDELVYRAQRGFVKAEPSSPGALERYLDRASRLKKHFQEVLFLEPESYQVAERAYHWIAAFVAVLASTWAFAWQIALTTRASGATTVSSGLVTLALIAGLVYAAKDRIKEIGRNWVTHRVHRVWGAQRITRYRAPARRVATRDVVVTARESFEQAALMLPDALNPECGATQPLTVIRYEHKGNVVPHAPLLGSGVRRVKHVFRYDLSPMFARLDDALKPVPVLDEATKRVRFIDAPRCYRVPVRISVSCGAESYAEAATLVLHKRGLERLEREERRDRSDPAVHEIGLEPA